MGRRSSISRLPPTVVQACHDLIRDGHSIDEIVAALRSLGAGQVSRSAVGRYVKSARESLAKYREAQEVAKVWVQRLEEEPNGDVSRLLPEMLRALVFQTLNSMGESEGNTDPKELMLLARTMRDLAGTSKTHVDVELQLRQERQRLLAEQSARLNELGRRDGVTPETLSAIRTALGIV